MSDPPEGSPSRQSIDGHEDAGTAGGSSVETAREYTRRARLLPAALVGLPLALTAVALFPSQPSWWKGIVGLLSSGAVIAFVTQIARTQGARNEQALFERWGGPPTTQLLRYAAARSKVQVAEFHRSVSRATDRQLPDEASELSDPGAADEQYSVAVRKLRRLTDDRQKFALVFEENVTYGYRRNLYGLKRFGIGSAVIGALTAGTLAVLAAQDVVEGSTFALGAVAVINLAIAAAWLYYVNDQWVREAGFTYAERLLEAADVVEPTLSEGGDT
jgi:hypothetical protein